MDRCQSASAPVSAASGCFLSILWSSAVLAISESLHTGMESSSISQAENGCKRARIMRGGLMFCVYGPMAVAYCSSALVFHSFCISLLLLDPCFD